MRTSSILILALTTAACGGDKRGAPVPPTRAAPVATTAEDVEALAAWSVYDVELAMLDHRGQAIALDVHRGHPTLVAMFYGSCTTACPRLLHDVETIVDALPPERRADTRVLLVSFDAARDTTARLAELAAQYELDPAIYTLAALVDHDARMLAAVLGTKYRKLDNGEFFHNSVITALDRDGMPVARLDGFVDVSPIVRSLTGMR
jgi:protein SCO1/2